MKKKLFFKLFIFAVIAAFVTVTSCKDYDDDISRIDAELSKTKTELASQLATLKTELGSTMDSKVKVVADDLAAAKNKLTTLEGNLATLQASAATKAEVDAVIAQIDAVKAEILEKTVSLDAFNEFKVVHETELATLVARIIALEADSATKAELNSAKKALEDQIAALSEAAGNYATKEALDDAVAALELVDDALSGKIQDLEENAATKAELAALQTEIATKLGTMQEELDAMGVRVEALETAYADLLAQHENDVQDLIEKIAELKAELNPRITAIETLLDIADGESGVLNKIAEDLADQLEKIGANADAIELLRSDLEEGLAGQLALIEANAAAIEAVAGDLETKYDLLVDADVALKEAIIANYDELDAKIGLNKADIDQLKSDLVIINATLEDFEIRISALEEALGIEIGGLSATVNSMITGISFDYENDDIWARWRNLNFSTAPAKLTWTFGQGLEGAIAFTKDARILDAEQVLEVKVNPATADLSKMLDKIYLIRRDGNNEINNYLVAVKAERSTALRAAPSVTGLWNITFKMPATANVAALPAITEDTNGNFYFALAIENSVDNSEVPAERFVISDFSITIDASTKTPIYNDQDAPDDLIFSVKKGNEAATAYKPHTDIKNRYAFTENAIPAKKDQKWNTGVWNTTATPTVDDNNDDRLAEDFFGVEVGKTFNVKLDNPDDVFAYYIVLDKEWAVESSPSEWNAWSSYDIEGINKVYKADEVANIQINSTSANGDIIGFRVVSVNYDGTLVDPDGKSFYTYVGDVAASALAFTQTITAPVPTATTTVPTNILAFAPAVNLANVGSAAFTMNIGHNVVLNNANLQMLDVNDAVTTNWANVKKLQIIGVEPSDLAEGVVYTGTLTLNNTLNVPFSTTNITLTKVLPTFDGTGIGYKTSIHHDVNGQQVVYAYPMPGTMAYNLANALNGIGADGTGYQVVNVNTTTNYPVASLPVWDVTNTNTAAVVPVAEIGVPYEPAAQPGHGKIFDLRLSKNFGYVLYDGSANYLVYWAPAIPLKVEFRSFVQDLTDWLYTGTNQANTPALKYGANLTGYAFTNITALPPAGARVDLTNTPALQDGRTFTVTGVRVLTGTNFNVVNEYFVPAINGTAFDFTAVITSTPAGPVPTKLEVTLTDNFGHAYTFVVPKVFNMTLN